MNTRAVQEFDLELTLSGDLWNSYSIWTQPLKSDDPSLECYGFCYFQHPDPIDCTFAVADERNKICYLGSILSQGTNGGLSIDKEFKGRIASSIL